METPILIGIIFKMLDPTLDCPLRGVEAGFFQQGDPKRLAKTQPFTLHTFHIVTLLYPPLIKHGNGKSNLHGCFKRDIIYEYLSIVIFPLPCLITRGIPEGNIR